MQNFKSHRPKRKQLVNIYNADIRWKENDDWYRIDRAGNLFINGSCANPLKDSEKDIHDNYKLVDFDNVEKFKISYF